MTKVTGADPSRAEPARSGADQALAQIRHARTKWVSSHHFLGRSATRECR
jgi:hypothetical protein